MKLTKIQKFMSGTVIGVMLFTASVGAVFAQDDTTSDEATAPICVMQRAQGEHPLATVIDELGLTREDIRDYEGTLQELLEENGIDVDALRAEYHANRTQVLLDCVDALEEDGSLTAEQAENLRTAIEDGSLQILREEGFGRPIVDRIRNARNGRGWHNGADGFFGNGIFGDDTNDDVTPEATTEADA